MAGINNPSHNTGANPSRAHPFAGFLWLSLLALAVWATLRTTHLPAIRTGTLAAAALLTLAIPPLRRAAATAFIALAIGLGISWAHHHPGEVAALSASFAHTLEQLANTAMDQLQASGYLLADRVRAHGSNERPAAPDSTAPYQIYLDKVDPRDPEINRLASRIAAPCQDADHVCETALLLEFVTTRIDYRNDPRGRGDYVKTPAQTLDARAGDCEDKTILLVSLLESLGNHTYMVFTDSHTYPMVCYNTPLDTLLAEKQRALGPRAFRQYLRRIAPGHDLNALRNVSKHIVFMPIDGRFCYPLEPTARGSWIGHDHGEPPGTIVDPVEGDMVAVRG